MVEPIEPKAFVTAMIAEVEAGEEPRALQRFMEEAFPRPVRGWLARLVSSPEANQYPIRRITLFDDGGFFRRSSVFEVVSSAGLLEGHLLPSGGSFGLFAVTATKADTADPGYRDAAPLLESLRFSYLSQGTSALEELLRSDGCAFEDADPVVLARLFSEVMLRKGNSSADLIGSREELASYSRYGEDYEVDASAMASVRARISAPSLVESASGFHLTYCAVFGWMHQKTSLVQYHFDIDRDAHIQLKEEILSRKIFKRTPMLKY